MFVSALKVFSHVAVVSRFSDEHINKEYDQFFKKNNIHIEAEYSPHTNKKNQLIFFVAISRTKRNTTTQNTTTQNTTTQNTTTPSYETPIHQYISKYQYIIHILISGNFPAIFKKFGFGESVLFL